MRKKGLTSYKRFIITRPSVKIVCRGRSPEKVGKWARDPKRESYFESFPPHPVRAHTNTNLLIPYATDYIM